MYNCKFCKPEKVDWEEQGFYGYICDSCIVGNTAFIALKDHRGELTKEEKRIFDILSQKYYPDYISYELSSRRQTLHWYEMFRKD